MSERHAPETVRIHGRSFVVVFPDTDAALGISARISSESTSVVTHASGRPWLVMHLPYDDATVGVAGPSSIAVIGRHDATESALEGHSARSRSAYDVAAVSARYAGSYLTVATIGGEIHASGAAMETRRLWSARIDGLDIVSDRADVLAELGGFDLDPSAVAVNLLGTVPYPIGRQSMWAQVVPVPGDRFVIIDQRGDRRRGGTWWTPPAPDLSRQEGAQRLRAAVESSVATRTTHSVTACDLSGELDSTPLCFFAASSRHGVLARTLYNNDPGGTEDLEWARKAATVTPGIHTHVVTSTDDFDDFHEGVSGVEAVLVEPTQAATAGPRIVAMLEDDRQRGIDTHLTGLGGDHILRGVPAWEHTLARRAPLRAWTRAR